MARQTNKEWAANARKILDENPSWRRPDDEASIKKVEATPDTFCSQGHPNCRNSHA